MASRYIPSLIKEHFTSFFVGSTSSGNSSPFFRNTSMGYSFGLSASFHSVWKKSYSLNPPTDSCLSPSSIKSSLGGRREKKPLALFSPPSTNSCLFALINTFIRQTQLKCQASPRRKEREEAFGSFLPSPKKSLMLNQFIVTIPWSMHLHPHFRCPA